MSIGTNSIALTRRPLLVVSARSSRLVSFMGVAAAVSALLFTSACSEEGTSADSNAAEADDSPPSQDGGDASSDAGNGSKVPPRGVIDAGSVPVIPPVNSASGDASTSPPGPVVLPDPAMPGPYEVSKEINVGVGFENPPTNANDQGDGKGCTNFVASFGEPADTAAAYATLGPDYNIELYTLYRPKTFEQGEKYPVVSWANGTCAKVSGYDVLLQHVASHGFIVIAAHSRYTGSGKAQLRAVDFVSAQNDLPDSPLYQHVDLERVGVFGHSQGGSSTWTAAADKRVKTSILLNSSGGGTRPTPTFFITGDNDIPGIALTARAATEAQAAAAFLQFHKVPTTSLAGHITLIKEPERVYPAVTAWFRDQLLGNDALAKAYFVGTDCKLCKQAADFDFYQKGIK